MAPKWEQLGVKRQNLLLNEQLSGLIRHVAFRWQKPKRLGFKWVCLTGRAKRWTFNRRIKSLEHIVVLRKVVDRAIGLEISKCSHLNYRDQWKANPSECLVAALGDNHYSAADTLGAKPIHYFVLYPPWGELLWKSIPFVATSRSITLPVLLFCPRATDGRIKGALFLEAM